MLPSTQTGKLRGFTDGCEPCLPGVPAEMRVSPGLAVCLAGSAGVLFSVFAACKHAPRDVDAEERAALIEALGPVRLGEGRLAGLPFAPLRHGGPWPRPRDEEAWASVVSEVEARPANEASPATLANQALVKLASQEPDQAIPLLRKAVASRQAGARVWSDLAAVELAQAGLAKDPHRLVLALEAADRALQLDSRLPEALFNRAKIAERLSLRSLAREDWRRYLDLDANSGWAQEARASHASLRSPSVVEEWTKARPLLEQAVAAGDEATLSTLARKFPHGTRGYLEGTVFRNWAKAIEKGDVAQAAHWVRTAHVLASRLLEATGDRLDAEAVSAIEGVPPALALDLARAHREYADGAHFYDSINYTLARPHFDAALGGFDRARSPFSLAARSQLAACDYQTGLWKQGMAAASEIRPAARSHAYGSLVGHSDWLIGVALLEAGHANLARPPLQEALEAFKKIHDRGSEAWIDSLLANCLTVLHANDESWRARLNALTTATRAGDPWALTTVFSAAARAVLKEKRTTEAILFQNEILNLAESSGDLQRIAEAHWGQAKIYHSAGDAAKAQELIAKAEAEASRIPDQPAAFSTLAGIATTAGEIWLRTDPQRAQESLTRALVLYRDNAYSRTDILFDRARARHALGKNRAAERDLADAVGELERQRDNIQPGQLRVTYFETARQVFEELIALELQLGRKGRAFDYAERAKARALLDSLAARHLAPAQPLVTTEVDRGLPSGTALIEYTVLSDRIVVWLRGAGRAERSVAHTIDWKRTDLEAAVGRLTRSIAVPSGDPAADTADFERLSSLFFTRLIAPFLDRVPPGATLVVVPDGALREVPFAALLDTRDSRFLIERNPLIVAPSATSFLAQPARRPGESRTRDRWQTLAVGGARIDFVLYPEHGLLPRTEQEARDVAEAHPGALLVEGNATVPNFLAALDRFELIHFAGHAGISPQPPSRPALLFAPAPGYRTGALDIDAIAARRLTRPRLAVLAACGAAGGSGLSLEGGADLARSFFEAGVPAVVGNLWSLDDKDASVFLEAFYRSFWKGQSATSALRAAQLEMIHHPDASFQRPAVWGGFRLLGTAAGQNLP